MSLQGHEPSVHELMDTHTNRSGRKPRELRPYQIEAVAAVEQDWADGIMRVGVSLPTGSGKSTVLGKLISDSYHDGGRIVVLAHRQELLHQIKRDTLLVDPDIPEQHMGFVVAEADDHTAPIVFATLQTLARAHRVHALGARTHIFWDEVHHAPAVGYHATFTELGGYDDAYMCGVTATMYRSDNSSDRKAQIGLGDVIEKISYEKDLRWAIENDYLVVPTGLTVRIAALNALNKIRNVAGDFHQGELAEVMEAAVAYTVDAVEKHAADRRSIIFGASVEACRQIVDLINERGNLRAALTIGTMDYAERKPIYTMFKNGEIDCMVTVMVLSEGADFPMCDCVVMARPTRSRVLYSQMVGRSLRPYEGKQNALVLDLSGSTRQMRLIHLSELVRGMGIDTREVDEDGEELEVPICPDTGESLETCMCAACVEERAPGERPIRVQREGPVDLTFIDLLGGNDVRWLTTPAGVPFLSLRDGWIVFLWPKDGRKDSEQWVVGRINTRNQDGGWCDDEEYMAQEEAVDFAQIYATATMKMPLPHHGDPWWRKNQAPSERQMSLARRMGIPGYANMTKGRCSDEISIEFARRVLDQAMEV